VLSAATGVIVSIGFVRCLQYAHAAFCESECSRRNINDFQIQKALAVTISQLLQAVGPGRWHAHQHASNHPLHQVQTKLTPQNGKRIRDAPTCALSPDALGGTHTTNSDARTCKAKKVFCLTARTAVARWHVAHVDSRCGMEGSAERLALSMLNIDPKAVEMAEPSRRVGFRRASSPCTAICICHRPQSLRLAVTTTPQRHRAAAGC
jgi:hypothetical protein